MHLFEELLSISAEEIEFEFRGFSNLDWLEFVLNPRRLRGSDFLMRWSQGLWSEERIIQAVNNTNEFFAIPYGPSGTAPDSDVRAFELYFERLEAAGLGKIKRPDLLIFKKSSREIVEGLVDSIGGISELPFTPEDSSVLRELLAHAIIAVECENSLWIAKQMPDFGSELRPQKWLGGKPGVKKGAVLPTLILKEEDRKPLQIWQDNNGIPIHIWHVFYDIAFGISFDRAQELIDQGFIIPTKQTFQSPGGATTTKTIYKIYYHYAYPLCDAVREPRLKAKFIQDKNGHILPYVHFEGGKMDLRDEALNVLREIANAKG
ncbi:AccI family restriction endonuclease [Thermanaerothrix sp. 4228-RoL]|uniref:AccI family restriction endonuclease n=1 Tax=Thermanaerothrix solaris TaxID=3058434 RepID=A0ABU3NNA4_9CHLR|nr:AccI family restriction endonuclease [Thermanaerothrix sp. 4228-RoL]MDT8898328.1 AccI family restriction endonuclease [Thermanaerothrix sp. 4228-RoL]